MQAVILAAGEGKRLRPLTNDRPKPMVLIGGEPILAYTLSILPDCIDEVILVVGYKQEKIREHFGDTWHGRRIVYVYQPEPKGTGEALERTRPLLRDEHFFILHGDDLYHPDDLATCTTYGDLALLVKETDRPRQMGICTVDEEGNLAGIIEKPEMPPSNLANVGVYVLNHEVFDIEKEWHKGEHFLAPQIGKLSHRRPIKVLRARFWHPIGYPEDIDRAHHYVTLHSDQRIN